MKSPPGQDANCLPLVLKRSWKIFLKRRKQCHRAPSEETVHQYRVASRRLLAELRLLKAALPELKIGRARRLLNACRKELGELRDTQVQRELLTRCAPSSARFRALKAELKTRETRLCQEACCAIRRSKLGKLEEDIDRLQKRMTSSSANAGSRNRMFRRASECAQQAFDEAIQLLAKVDYARPKTIHSLRIAFKRFRYTVEALPETMVPSQSKLRRALSAYQDAMGRIQDLEVLSNTVTDFGKANSDQASGMVPLLRDLKIRRTRAIAAFKRGSSKLASFWPPGMQTETRWGALPAATSTNEPPPDQGIPAL